MKTQEHRADGHCRNDHHFINLIIYSLLYFILVIGAVSCSSSSCDDTKTTDALIEDAFDKWTESYNINGATLYVYVGDTMDTYIQSIGVSNVEEGTSFLEDSDVRIGSVTKTMTATVILQLIQEGKLSLDDTLSEFVSDYPNGETITIEHLLRHRSGIPEIQLDDLNFILYAIQNDEKWFTPEEILDWTHDDQYINSLSQGQLIPKEPVCEPGELFHYSQPGFIALGLIIETVTGEDLGDVYEERIFNRLEMSDTYLPEKDGPHDPLGYTNLFGMREDTIPTTELVPSLNSLNSASWSAGGIVSTAPDMFKFFYGLLNNELLTETSFQYMTDWIDTLSESDGDEVMYEYGMGFARTTYNDYTIIGHNGSVPGSGSVMQYIVDDDIYIVVVRNTDMSSTDTTPPNLLELIREAVQEGTE